MVNGIAASIRVFLFANQRVLPGLCSRTSKAAVPLGRKLHLIRDCLKGAEEMQDVQQFRSYPPTASTSPLASLGALLFVIR